MFSEPLHDLLFADFIHSVGLSNDRDALVREALVLRDTRETVYKSNRGYQSNYYERGSPKPSEDGLGSLERVVDDSYEYVCEYLSNSHGTGVRQTGWWLNINVNDEYNVPHNHGRCDLIGMYYISAPPRSGRLCLDRNDGSSYSSLYDNVTNGRRFELEPEEGRLYIFPGHLWHWVEPNLTDHTRISVAINFYLDQWSFSTHAVWVSEALNGLHRHTESLWVL